MLPKVPRCKKESEVSRNFISGYRSACWIVQDVVIVLKPVLLPRNPLNSEPLIPKSLKLKDGNIYIIKWDIKTLLLQKTGQLKTASLLNLYLNFQGLAVGVAKLPISKSSPSYLVKE